MSDFRKMIVKVQRPIAPPPPEGEALVYDMARTITSMLPWDWVADVMGDDLKRYFHARFDLASGQLHIDGRAPDQDW